MIRLSIDVVRHIHRAALVAALITALSACKSEPIAPDPAVEGSPPTASERPLRVAMSAAFVSESGVDVYKQISDYLASKTGMEIEFLTGFGYQTINDMLTSGAIDVGFICGLPYVLLHDREQPAVMLLAAPVMEAKRYRGEPKYYSDLIVHKDSDIQSFADLTGRTYAFNEEISNSGYNMPRYRMIELGLTDGVFASVTRSGSHEESIRWVAEGKADASFVDSLVLDYDRTHNPGVADRVRVIESVGPAGIPPVVASRYVPAARRRALRRYLLNMHRDPTGIRILARAQVARFVDVEDANYDDIRAMKRAAETASFAEIR